MAEPIIQREALLDRLTAEQADRGYLSDEFLSGLAVQAGLSVGQVYGVATFYGFLSTKPQGRHIIRVCRSVPCCLKDAEKIIDWLDEELGIGPGQTTPDGRFTLEPVNCIGTCDQAPAMLLGDRVFGHLTRDRISVLLRSLK